MRLAGNSRDVLEVGIVVEHDGTVMLCHRCGQQVDHAGSTMVTAACHPQLDVTSPVCDHLADGQ
jgi:hypothetical protein